VVQELKLYLVLDLLDLIGMLCANMLVNKLLSSEWLCANLASPLCSIVLLGLSLEKLENISIGQD